MRCAWWFRPSPTQANFCHPEPVFWAKDPYSSLSLTLLDNAEVLRPDEVRRGSG